MKNIIIILLFLTSCSHQALLNNKVEKLEKSNFHNALAIGYNNLAQREEEQYDWLDSSYFAKKGLSSLELNEINPDHPNSRAIQNNFYKNEIIIAYNALTKLFDNNEIKRKFPLQAARIHIIYDYWLEQLEENWQENEIARFRNEFWDIHNNIEANIILYNNNVEKLENSNIYTIYFPNYKHIIDSESLAIISNIYYRYKLIDNSADAKIILESYITQEEAAQYKDELSVKRNKIIKDLLIEMGVDETSFYKEATNILPHNNIFNTKVEIYIIDQSSKNTLKIIN